MDNDKIVFQNAQFVVRVREEKDELRVFIHRKTETGVEAKPLAYLLGYNAAIMGEKFYG